MHVLVIGFGSIGRRHYDILNSFDYVTSVHVITKQKLNFTLNCKLLNEITDLSQYDYFVIASETYKHYEQLEYICKHVDSKKILVEKPLYDKSYESIQCKKNKVFTAYNLRFHPVIQKLEVLLEKETVYFVNVICGQYLPTWRPEQDYQKSYSASIEKGGGVLRDLSHELDYVSHLFGSIKELNTINAKVSDLKINSDDIFTAVGITEKKVIVNISLDYISKTPIRKILIHTKNYTFEVDLIQNNIKRFSETVQNESWDFDVIDRNLTYKNMHENILSDHYDKACSLDKGLEIVNLINGVNIKEL